MKMPLADIIDRLSIAMLKQHEGGAKNDNEIASLQDGILEALEGRSLPDGSIKEWLNRLLIHNAMIWSLESDIRQGKEGELGLSEVGRRAIRIREHNTKRCAVKAEIAMACGDFVEQKINHASAGDPPMPPPPSPQPAPCR